MNHEKIPEIKISRDSIPCIAPKLFRNSGADNSTARATTSLSSLTSAWVSSPLFCITSVKYCGSRKFIRDPNFSILDPGSKRFRISESLLPTRPLVFCTIVRWQNYQCCGSGMFIPDPDFSHPGSRIQKQQQKRGVKKFVVISFFCSHKFNKIETILFLKCWRKKKFGSATLKPIPFC